MVAQLILRLLVASAVVIWSWSAPPIQQLLSGCAGGLLLITLLKPHSRLSACLDVLAVLVLQVYSAVWIPLSAWVLATHRRTAHWLGFALAVVPFAAAWRTGGDLIWWTALFAPFWVYLGFAMYERHTHEDEIGSPLLPLPDELREQWEQEREAHRQLRHQYRELVTAHRALQEQLQTEQTLRKLLRASVAESPDEIVQQWTSLIGEQVSAEGVAVWFFEPHSSALQLVRSNFPLQVPANIPLPDEPTLLQQANDYFHSALKPLGERTLAFLLHSDSQIVGAIALYAPRDSLAILRERLLPLRDTLSEALRAVIHRDTLRQQNEGVNALYEISRISSNMQSDEDLAQKLVAIIAKLLDAPFVTLYLRLRDSEQLQVVAAHGEPIVLMDDQQFSLGNGLAGWIAEQAKPFLLPNTATEPRLLGYASRRIFASLIGIPLLLRQRVDGVLIAAHSTPGYFNARHMERLIPIMNQFAQVLEHLRLTRSVSMLALTDGLTGLFNRRYMNMRLEEEIRRCQRYQKRFSVVLLDIDHFKQVNDVYGHATGDMVLREASRLLQQNVRETELLFRYGGEELLIILPETGLSQAYELADRLREKMQRHPFRTADGSISLNVTMSAGVAEFPMHGNDASSLLSSADEALYLAKQYGRNRVAKLPAAA